MTDAKCDQEHIDMIILSHASVPDRTSAIKSGNTHEVFHALLSDALMLEKNGATAIAIPCNTSHYFWKPLQAELEIPIVNMVRATVEKVKTETPSVNKIGVLATDGTLYTGIYKTECERLGIEYVQPDDDIQKIVMDIIYNQIKKGEKGNWDDFIKIDTFMKDKGCQKVILACTELSCFAENYALSDYYIDALNVLCEQSIILCGKKLKKGVNV